MFIEQFAIWTNIIALILIGIVLLLVFFGIKQGSVKNTSMLGLACSLIPVTGLMTYPHPAPTWGFVLLGLIASAVFVVCLSNVYQTRNAANEYVFGLMGAFMAFSSIFVCGLNIISVFLV